VQTAFCALQFVILSSFGLAADEVRRTEGPIATVVGVTTQKYCQGNASVIQALADAVKASPLSVPGIHVVTDETGALLSKPSPG
jgi:hypothetical protein